MCTVALRQQQQMLHAQQIQAQQAQQLQFQQMQAQQWQYQAQAAQAQQMAQQPAPQAAAQASDPVPAKPQETKDTATDLLRAGAKLARIWHESNRRLFMVVHVLRQSESQILLARLGALWFVETLKPKSLEPCTPKPKPQHPEKPTARQAAKAVDAARLASEGQTEETKEVTIF